MIRFENKQMIEESLKAKHKPMIILQILIFFAVMIAISTVSSAIIGVPQAIWLVTSNEFINAVVTADINGLINVIMNIITAMPEWLMLLSLFATIVEIALPIIYVKFIEKRSLESMGIIKTGAVKKYAVGYGIGAGMIVIALLLSVIFGAMTVSVNSLSFKSVSVIFLFFLGYIVQGAAEEVLCRGYFAVSLSVCMKNKGRFAIAIIVSSVVFSLLHIGNPGFTLLAFVNIVLAGVFFALLMFKTGSLFTAAAAHSAWNFFQGNILGVSVSGMGNTTSVLSSSPVLGNGVLSGGIFGLEGGLCASIVLIAGIILLIFLPDNNK